MKKIIMITLLGLTLFSCDSGDKPGDTMYGDIVVKNEVDGHQYRISSCGGRSYYYHYENCDKCKKK